MNANRVIKTPKWEPARVILCIQTACVKKNNCFLSGIVGLMSVAIKLHDGKCRILLFLCVLYKRLKS